MRGEVGFMAEWELGVLFGPRLSLICHFVGAYDDVLESGFGDTAEGRPELRNFTRACKDSSSSRQGRGAAQLREVPPPTRG